MTRKNIDILEEIRLKMFYDMSLTENENKLKLDKKISEQSTIPQVTATTKNTTKPKSYTKELEKNVEGYFDKPQQDEVQPYSTPEVEMTPQEEMEYVKKLPIGTEWVIENNMDNKYNKTRVIKRKINAPQDPNKFSVEVVTQVWDPKKPNKSINPSGSLVYDPYTKDGVRTIYPLGDWADMTYKNVGLRGTPYGFHPDEYPKYLQELEQIKKNKKLEGQNIYDKTKQKSDYLGKGGEFEKKYGIDVNNKEIQNLLQKYYHGDFWKGIEQEQYQDFKKRSDEYEKEYQQMVDKINKEHGLDKESTWDEIKFQTKEKLGFNEFPDTETLNKKMANISLDEFKQLYDYKKLLLGIIFDYDPSTHDKILEENKSELEKFWSQWGWTIELAGFLLLDAFTDGLFAAVTSEYQLTLMGRLITRTMPKVVSKFKSFSNPIRAVKLTKLAAQSGLPLGISSYIYLDEGKFTEHGLMYMCFAFLPYLHEFYGWSKGLPKNYNQVADGIIAKMARKNLESPIQLSLFIRSLTEEERYWVSKVWFMSQESLKKGLDFIAKKVGTRTAKLLEAEIKAQEMVLLGATSKTIVYQIPKSLLSKTMTGLFKFFGTMVHDVSIIKWVKSQLEDMKIMDVNRQKEFLEQYENIQKQFPFNQKLKLFAATEFARIIKENSSITPQKAIQDLKQTLEGVKNETDGEINLRQLNNLTTLGFGSMEGWTDSQGNPITQNDQVTDEELDAYLEQVKQENQNKK